MLASEKGRPVVLVDGKGLPNVRRVKCWRTKRRLGVEVETSYLWAKEELPEPTEDATLPLEVRDMMGTTIASGMARLVQRCAEMPDGVSTRTFVFELKAWEGTP